VRAVGCRDWPGPGEGSAAPRSGGRRPALPPAPVRAGRGETPLSDDELETLLSGIGDAVLLAVSGGPDSTALMGAAALLARAEMHVATVDHGLRPGSRAEAEVVARQAAVLGLPHRILVWEGEKPGTGLQAAARAARYALLAAHARALGAVRVATAHTRDDQAETVLLRLAAGSGVAGLAGMRRLGELDGLALARPFLDVPKARLVATCRARGWTFVEDPSNTDPRFARARLRRARKVLAAEGLTDARLASLARRAARADDALEAAAAAALANLRRPGGLDGAGLLDLPEAVALRVIGRSLADAGEAAPRLERLERLVLEELLPALAAGQNLRRTLGGVLVTARPDRSVALAPAPPRRRPAGS
jgi:tRNA(Ile)-lysidine synthase